MSNFSFLLFVFLTTVNYLNVNFPNFNWNMESEHLKFDFCIKSISLIFLEIARVQKPAFSQYFCDFVFDPESIRNWIAVIFGQRKFLILIRFGLFQFYWEFKVFDFPFAFAICA